MPIELLQNAALLSITALGLVWVFQSEDFESSLLGSVCMGLVFAVAAFLVTATPIHLEDGATIDARAGPVLVAGMLGGPVAGVLAAVGGGAARSLIGGSFAFAGVLVYFLYAAAGTLVWRRFFTRQLGKELSPARVIVAIGLSLIAAGLIFFVIQPRARAEMWLVKYYPWIAVANTLSVIFTAIFAAMSITYARQRRELVNAFQTIDLAKKAGGIGIWSYAPAEETVYWDATNQDLHGLEISGDEGRFEDWEATVHPDDQARVKAEFADALAGRSEFDTEYRVVHPDGRIRTLKGNATIERNAMGEARRVVGTNFDVTPLIEKDAELKQTRSIAVQAQKLDLVGKLSGGVAHDFNNLLAIIQGNLEFLIDDEETRFMTPEERMDTLTSAISATRRGAELTRSMLAFARRSHLDPQPIQINDVVRETERWIARALPASIEINTSLQPQPWPLRLDLASLQSAIVNVIVNARDAMPEGGKLTVETTNTYIDQAYAEDLDEYTPEGRYVLVAISDTGTGIDPSFLPNVFDPFVSSKDMASGSGLGLSMVQGFVRQSGGFVKIYSEMDVGTSVKMFFPVDEELSPPVVVPEPQPEPLTERPARILVAEDQIEVLGVVVRALQNAGYSVDAATSGDEALTFFMGTGPYDLLVTDVVMPGHLKGPDLARACRKRVPDLPVIFLSGYASEATVHGNGLRPEDIRLMKPVPKAELLSAVRTSLDALKDGTTGAAD